MFDKLYIYSSRFIEYTCKLVCIAWCRMVNQSFPHQGSESELKDVIANIASKAQALEAVQTTEQLSDVLMARMAPLGLPRIEQSPNVVEPNPLPRAYRALPIT